MRFIQRTVSNFWNYRDALFLLERKEHLKRDHFRKTFLTPTIESVGGQRDFYEVCYYKDFGSIKFDVLITRKMISIFILSGQINSPKAARDGEEKDEIFKTLY